MSFFSDDEGGKKGNNDPFEYVWLTVDAVKMGIFALNICMFPFFLLGRIISSITRQIPRQPEQDPGTHWAGSPPPRFESPPFNQYQAPPKPPPPPDPFVKYRVILGVGPTDNKDQIKKRYRFLCQLCHPDKVAPNHRAEAEEEFKKLYNAYTILCAAAPEAPPKAKAHEAQRPKAAAPKPKREPPKTGRQTETPKSSPKPPAENVKSQTNPKPAAQASGAKPPIKSPDLSAYQKPKYF